MYFWKKVDVEQYYLTDHLGNNRVVFKDGGGGVAEVVQESHFYLFGMGMEGSWSQNNSADPENDYLYNGKELQDDFELGWYDYGFRMYDPAIARFASVDPAASKYTSISTYAYVANNPIAFVDPRGDTLRAVNGVSGERALSLIQNSFNSVSTARGVFSLGDDGITFNSISQEAIDNAVGGLSDDEAALFRGYAAAINGSETNVVEVVKRGESISKYGRDAIGYLTTGKALDASDGGGKYGQAVHDGNIVKSGANGNYAVVLMDSNTQVKYSNGARKSLPGEVLAHELLGHGLGGRGIGNNGVDASIQMGNIYLRAKGYNYFRQDHTPGIHSRKFNTHSLPSFVKPLWKR